MAVSVKLRCGSWDQLAALLERDLRRAALFLRSERPPPAGTDMRIELSLPSGSVVYLDGRVAGAVSGARGKGFDVALGTVPQSALWVIESALRTAARQQPATAVVPPPPQREPLVADEAPAAAAEDELVAALEQELVALRNMNPFQVLGVPYDTTDDAVRAAFGDLSKKYHPDRFARYESEAARLAAAEIFMVVREAYRKIATLAGRQATRPRATAPPPPPASVSSPPASSSLAEADFLLANGAYAEAIRAYDAVLATSPHDRAARVGRELAQGLAALHAGDRDRAAARFEAALEIDPLNERAARELAVVRRAATEARKGMLGKLLGRQR